MSTDLLTLSRTDTVTTFGPGTAATSKDLKITKGLSFEEWLEIGRQLLARHESSRFWIGDWLVYGEWGGYGEAYRTVMDELDLAFDTVRQYAYVAGHVPEPVRRDDLSWRHHYSVAKLRPPDQERWLALAAENGWAYRTLADEIAAATPRPAPKVSAASGARAPTVEPPGYLQQVSFSTLPDRVAAWTAAAEDEGLDLVSFLIAAGDERAGFTPEA